MKTYKTWEVIKELTEKPYLRFKNGLGNIVTTSKVTKEIIWEANESQLEDTFILFNHAVNCDNLHIDWVLVPQPVTFIEAVKAYAEGKTIRCEVEGCTNEYIPKRKNDEYCVINACVKEILEGIWYIEEGYNE